MKDALRVYASRMHRALSLGSLILSALWLAVLVLGYSLWPALIALAPDHPLQPLLRQHQAWAPWLLVGPPALLATLMFLSALGQLGRSHRIRQSDRPWQPLYGATFLFLLANLALPLWLEVFLAPQTTVRLTLPGSEPTPTASETASATPTPTATESPTPTPTPEASPTPARDPFGPPS